MKIFAVVCVVITLFSMIEARGRGGGGRSSSSSSRGSSSTRASSTATRTSTSSAGWTAPTRTSTPTKTSTSAGGWTTPTRTSTTSLTSSTYGWNIPSTTTTGVTTPTRSSTSGTPYGWVTPSTSTSASTIFGSNPTSGQSGFFGGNSFLLGGGGKSYNSGSTNTNSALRLGASAGAARFCTRTRYRGSGFSFESSSIEDNDVPWRTVALSASQQNTCSAAVRNQNRTLMSLNSTSSTVKVSIYADTEFQGARQIIELPSRQCVNVHQMDSRWNDRASSIDPGNACMMIWEHADCKGKFACFTKASKGSNSFRGIGMNDELTSLQLC